MARAAFKFAHGLPSRLVATLGRILPERIEVVREGEEWCLAAPDLGDGGNEFTRAWILGEMEEAGLLRGSTWQAAAR